MRVMLIGGGGREHAIALRLAQSPEVEVLYALPGNAGIAQCAECVDIKANDVDAIVDFAKSSGIDYAVVAPDDPLVLGVVDRLGEIGVEAFGPNRSAARIEGSKAFAKQFMKRHGIPTADFEIFDDIGAAREAVSSRDEFPVVIKADGLALGKGVIIAENRSEALEAVENMMERRVFGDSGRCVIFERFERGPEVSVLCFTDTDTIVPMASSMDHKRALDNDRGLNTGGMGTVAPNPFYTDDMARRCMEEIFLPTVRGFKKDNITFRGCLYFGLMLTENGPKVIEYNCRFGDPETQVVLPLLEGDLLDIMRAVSRGRLSEAEIGIKEGAACCVIAASGGYPAAYEKGKPIDFSKVEELTDVFIYHAGTAIKNGKIVTSGGRVLGATAVGADLAEAVQMAYKAIEKISFDGMFYRRDIGAKALGINGGK